MLHLVALFSDILYEVVVYKQCDDWRDGMKPRRKRAQNQRLLLSARVMSGPSSSISVYAGGASSNALSDTAVSCMGGGAIAWPEGGAVLCLGGGVGGKALEDDPDPDAPCD